MGYYGSKANSLEALVPVNLSFKEALARVGMVTDKNPDNKHPGISLISQGGC